MRGKGDSGMVCLVSFSYDVSPQELTQNSRHPTTQSEYISYLPLLFSYPLLVLSFCSVGAYIPTPPGCDEQSPSTTILENFPDTDWVCMWLEGW
jgi:hypothetical protein